MKKAVKKASEKIEQGGVTGVTIGAILAVTGLLLIIVSNQLEDNMRSLLILLGFATQVTGVFLLGAAAATRKKARK